MHLRWEALSATVEQLLRVAALPLLAAYLRGDDGGAPKLNKALLALAPLASTTGGPPSTRSRTTPTCGPSPIRAKTYGKEARQGSFWPSLAGQIPHFDARLKTLRIILAPNPPWAQSSPRGPRIGRNHHGVLSDAVGLYDQAIAIRQRLVERGGQAEFAADLALALMNKANAPQDLGRMLDAVAAYDQAITTIQRLIERGGGAELANDLADALMNKALVLEKQEEWSEALACDEDSIRRREACVLAGKSYLLGELLKDVRYRLTALCGLGPWGEAAADVVRFLGHAAPALEAVEPPAGVSREYGAFRALLRALPDEARRAREPGLGAWAEVVRGLAWTSD